ncbi:MAG TPA: recombination protein O N-terminal domain-containing protein [Candidatus Paceibacterota bacterium]
MPHYLYRTEGFIVASRPTGEGSRVLDLVTERLGRLPVLAQGSRELRSKLRYQLSDLSFINATLVRGREIWRLVGVEPIIGLDSARLLAASSCRVLLARLALLLRRLLVTNELSAEPQIYAEVRAAVNFLTRHDLSAVEREQYEVAAVWRLLAKLGYGRRTTTLEKILSPENWNHDLLAVTAICQSEAVASINEALYHSQL